MIISLCIQTCVAILLLLLRSHIGKVFSNDALVISTVEEIFPITAVMLLSSMPCKLLLEVF